MGFIDGVHLVYANDSTLHVFLGGVGVCLGKIDGFQPPGKINLSGHSDTRLQIQS